VYAIIVLAKRRWTMYGKKKGGKKGGKKK